MRISNVLKVLGKIHLSWLGNSRYATAVRVQCDPSGNAVAEATDGKCCIRCEWQDAKKSGELPSVLVPVFAWDAAFSCAKERDLGVEVSVIGKAVSLKVGNESIKLEPPDGNFPNTQAIATKFAKDVTEGKPTVRVVLGVELLKNLATTLSKLGVGGISLQIPVLANDKSQQRGAPFRFQSTKNVGGPLQVSGYIMPLTE